MYVRYVLNPRGGQCGARSTQRRANTISGMDISFQSFGFRFDVNIDTKIQGPLESQEASQNCKTSEGDRQTSHIFLAREVVCY